MLLTEEPKFRDLAAQVHEQNMLLDGILVMLQAHLPPAAWQALLDNVEANAASIGPRGSLSDAKAEYVADIKVRSRRLLETRLAPLRR